MLIWELNSNDIVQEQIELFGCLYVYIYFLNLCDIYMSSVYVDYMALIVDSN